MARHVIGKKKSLFSKVGMEDGLYLYKGNINSKVEKISEGLPDTYQGTLVMGTDGKPEWLNQEIAVIMEPIRGSWPIEPTERGKKSYKIYA